MLVPTRGVALFINAFNFPSWGLWEKAGPALLSGVPVIVKPATATAWLTQRMVQDVNEAGILPPGALSVVCGSSAGLLDQLEPFDVVSFTGSAETGRHHPLASGHRARLRAREHRGGQHQQRHAAARRGARAARPSSCCAKEVAREMTQKSGQKCTAIRRVFVPQALYAQAAEAIAARLAKTTVGNPRNDTVRMGALVSRAQLSAVRAGLADLKQHAEVLHDGATHALVDADPAVACCIGPTLLGARDPHGEFAGARPRGVRPRRHLDALPRCGRKASRSCAAAKARSWRRCTEATRPPWAPPRSNWPTATAACTSISPDVAALHTGHGNVMPQSLHGGPGRAGGGEELGGVRALNFYHRRAAVQAASAVLSHLS